jgi:hypothetical protein
MTLTCTMVVVSWVTTYFAGLITDPWLTRGAQDVGEKWGNRVAG